MVNRGVMKHRNYSPSKGSAVGPVPRGSACILRDLQCRTKRINSTSNSKEVDSADKTESPTIVAFAELGTALFCCGCCCHNPWDGVGAPVPGPKMGKAVGSGDDDPSICDRVVVTVTISVCVTKLVAVVASVMNMVSVIVCSDSSTVTVMYSTIPLPLVPGSNASWFCVGAGSDVVIVAGFSFLIVMVVAECPRYGCRCEVSSMVIMEYV